MNGPTKNTNIGVPSEVADAIAVWLERRDRGDAAPLLEAAWDAIGQAVRACRAIKPVSVPDPSCPLCNGTGRHANFGVDDAEPCARCSRLARYATAPAPTTPPAPDLTAALEAYRLAAIAEHAASTDRGASIRDVRAAVVTLQEARDDVFAAVAPPAIPADQPPPNPTGLALVRALADQRRNPVIVVQSYDAALLRTRETDEWGVDSSFDRAWQYDREGASWGLTKAEAMRRYATITLQGFCEACVALYDSGVDECPTCHPPVAETQEEPSVAAVAPPAIPADLRALLEEQRRLTRAVHDDVEDEDIREAWHDALEAVNAWTRAHAGGGR